MKCEICGKEIEEYYFDIDGFEVCGDCHENLTIYDLIKLLNIQIQERNLVEEQEDDVNDFRYRQYKERDL